MCENRKPTFGSSRLVMFFWLHPVQTQPRKIKISRTLLRRHLKNWSQAPGVPGAPGFPGRRLIPAPGLSGSQRAQDAKRTTQTSESHHPTDALTRCVPTLPTVPTGWSSGLPLGLAISSGPVVSHRKNVGEQVGYEELQSQPGPVKCCRLIMAPEACPNRLGSVWKVWRNPPNFRGSVHHAPVKRCS